MMYMCKRTIWSQVEVSHITFQSSTRRMILAPCLTQTACAAQCLPLSHCSCLNSHSLVSLSCSLCSSRSKVLKAIQQKLYFLLRSSEAVLLSRLDKSRFAQISGRLWKIARIFVIWPGFFLWFSARSERRWAVCQMFTKSQKATITKT